MCTLTIIPIGNMGNDGTRVACNRDELRTRGRALPPRAARCGSYTAIMPIDPDAGGTWIGASERGIAAALLNLSPRSAPPAPDRPMTRGAVIPAVLAADDLETAAALVSTCALARMRPFRLVIVAGRSFVDSSWDGTRFAQCRPAAIERPLLWTSSGLGDHVVEGPRRELFEGMLAAAPPHVRSLEQDRLHRHAWPDRPSLSVRMTRDDARTVSLTVVELDGASAVMTHHDWCVEPPVITRETLELAPATIA